jgi:trehalose 6-phosphate phosphatase
VLDALRDEAGRAGIFLDFDGSLSAIVARPELARPEEGAREVLAALVARYRLVAIISGRPADELARRIDVHGLTYEGLYGMDEAAADLTLTLLPEAERAASAVPEAWVEDKRMSVAVHYRQAPDPASARRRLVTTLEPVAAASGMRLVEGKKVVELVPNDRPMKGGALERLFGEAGLEAGLFAGDDVADVDAFAALERLASRGHLAIKVAVRGPEAPRDLLERADVIVDGPRGLIDLLGELA